VPHTLVVDNAGGHLMQHGLVDVCLVGSDRTTSAGDVCNKIGTYLKALAAYDNQIPFYAALPVSTVDFASVDGVREIPIEERAAAEVTHVQGLDHAGVLRQVQVSAPGTAVSNFGFDVTPSRLVTGIITELGVFPATAAGLLRLRELSPEASSGAGH
jgi:methylthioribose-1-phosphate isomerase